MRIVPTIFLNTSRLTRRQFDTFRRDFRQQLDFIPRNHVRRHEVNHVAHGPEQHAAFERMLIDPQSTAFLPWIGRAGIPVLDHLDGEDHTVLADFRDLRVSR